MERWALHAVARRLLPGERVARCLWRRRADVAGVQVLHSPATASAHYGGLEVCGSVWACPRCATVVSERRREEVTRAVDAARARGWTVLLLTYTASHTWGHDLRGLLGAFLGALKGMHGTRAYRALAARYGVVGAIRALETTWGASNGWHPHCHTLLFLDGDGSAGVDVAAMRRELYPLWERAAAARGLSMTQRRGLVVQVGWPAVAAYVAKWGHAPRPGRRLWDLADEVTRAQSKRVRGRQDAGDGDGDDEERYSPFDLLREVLWTGDLGPGARFCEYAAAFKGRRQLVWSPGLRRLLLGDEGERSDDELAREEREEAAELAVLGVEDWRAVRYALGDHRGDVLEVARSGDAAAVLAYVAVLVAALRAWERDDDG